MSLLQPPDDKKTISLIFWLFAIFKPYLDPFLGFFPQLQKDIAIGIFPPFNLELRAPWFQSLGRVVGLRGYLAGVCLCQQR